LQENLAENLTEKDKSKRGLRPLHLPHLLKRFGGAKRDRTADLYNAIVALSQLSYSPLLPCMACNAPSEDIAKTPVRFQIVQCRNAAKDMYRRGDALRKQIFI
jgi:hypothetical protein